MIKISKKDYNSMVKYTFDKNASYLILSLMDKDNPVLNSFHIDGLNAEKEELIIAE